MQDRPESTPALKSFPIYIDGKWTSSRSGKTFKSYNPYTAQPWAEIPDCDAGDVEAAVTAGATHVRVGSAILGPRPSDK